MSVKIITMGMDLDTDFGHPSLLHGTYELLRELYGGDLQFTHYQFNNVHSELIDDLEFQVRSVPISYKQMFKAYIKWIFRGRIREDVREFFEDLKSADLVVDPFGIRFCDKFCGDESDVYHMIRYYCSEFMPFLIARWMKKPIIKTAASYGGITKPATKKTAKFMGNKIYTEIIARETQSRAELIQNGGVRKDIRVSPDVANLFDVNAEVVANRVGISTSFQIERQFKNGISYVQAVAGFCEYVNKKTGADIILIPNQTLPNNARDDVVISKEIYEVLKEKRISAQLVDIHKTNSTELKSIIASCGVLVGSRYHSCVAALSSGVPVLVVGWHHKYEELLKEYLQSDMLIDVRDFDMDAMKNSFDELWATREERVSTIKREIPKVRNAVIAAAKVVFSKYGKMC